MTTFLSFRAIWITKKILKYLASLNKRYLLTDSYLFVWPRIMQLKHVLQNWYSAITDVLMKHCPMAKILIS